MQPKLTWLYEICGFHRGEDLGWGKYKCSNVIRNVDVLPQYYVESQSRRPRLGTTITENNFMFGVWCIRSLYKLEADLNIIFLNQEVMLKLKSLLESQQQCEWSWKLMSHEETLL